MEALIGKIDSNCNAKLGPWECILILPPCVRQTEVFPVRQVTACCDIVRATMRYTVQPKLLAATSAVALGLMVLIEVWAAILGWGQNNSTLRTALSTLHSLPLPWAQHTQ